MEDSLFNLVVKASENIAFATDWWESLPASDQDKISEAAMHGANILTFPDASYLQADLNINHGWAFNSVSEVRH